MGKIKFPIERIAKYLIYIYASGRHGCPAHVSVWIKELRKILEESNK